MKRTTKNPKIVAEKFVAGQEIVRRRAEKWFAAGSKTDAKKAPKMVPKIA